MNRNLAGNDAPVDSSRDDDQFLGLNSICRRLDQQASVVLANARSATTSKPSSAWQPAEETTKSGDLISDALIELSPGDRERAANEVHGVNEQPEASRRFVDDKVMELQQWLRLQTRQPNDPLSQPFASAAMQNPEFAYHPVSCERFLRVYDFDVSRAASAVLRHFQWKLQLWGEAKLGKQIELDDLSEADIEVLKRGYFQVLPERDRAGRQICAAIMNNQKYPSPLCAARVLWYTFQLRLDQPSELMAVLLIFHLVHPSPTALDCSSAHKHEQEISACRVFSALSLKKAACHHCVPDSSSPQFQVFIGNLLEGVDNDRRARTRVHSGSFSDWMLSLRSYGIPSHIAPINDEGRIRVKNHLEFLQGRKTQELLARGRAPQSSIILPLNSDILFGRGKPIQQTAGNLRLGAIVDSYVTEYHQLSSKQEKTALAAHVVQIVKVASGRFLSKNSGLWIEVTDDIAREKVSGLFRTLYRKRFDGGEDNAAGTARSHASMDSSMMNEDDDQPDGGQLFNG